MTKQSNKVATIHDSKQVDQQSHRPLDIIDEMTPELVEARLKRQAALRNSFLKFIRGSMTEGVHFQPPARRGTLPYLKQEGGLLLKDFFECDDDYEIIRETWENDFYAISIKCYLRHPSGKVYVGLGWGNSREYNFVAAVEAQAKSVINSGKSDMTPEAIKQAFYYTQLETVQQMARKRALVSAARHLPFVSELFTAEAENGNGERKPAGVARNSEEALKNRHNKRMRYLMKWCQEELEDTSDEIVKSYLGGIVGEDILSKSEFVENDDFWEKFSIHVNEIEEDRAHRKGI